MLLLHFTDMEFEAQLGIVLGIEAMTVCLWSPNYLHETEEG